MSEDKDAKYPGQGGIGEAYANLHKERKEEIENIFPMWNVRDLVNSIACADREIAPLKRQIEEIEQKRSELITRLKRIMNDAYTKF